tara:strand:+ start:355 stop:519 length:165 start_codon:yes stop_codon:yes gene_type:complete
MITSSLIMGSSGSSAGTVIDSFFSGIVIGSVEAQPLREKIINKMIIITTTGFNK